MTGKNNDRELNRDPSMSSMRENYNLFLHYKLLTGNSYDEAKRRAIDQSTSVRVLVVNKLLESGKLSKEKHQYLLQNVSDHAFSDSVGYYIRKDTKTKGAARSPRKRSRPDDDELTYENAFQSESSISHHPTERDWTMDMANIPERGAALAGQKQKRSKRIRWKPPDGCRNLHEI